MNPIVLSSLSRRFEPDSMTYLHILVASNYPRIRLRFGTSNFWRAMSLAQRCRRRNGSTLQARGKESGV